MILTSDFPSEKFFASYYEPSREQIKKIVLTLLEDTGEQSVYLIGNPNHLLFDSLSIFTVVEAGGGVVRNQQGEVLFIYRDGLWDLPKGKHEKGESIRQTAIREVCEECGLEQLAIDEYLDTTFHFYLSQEGEIVLKKTAWFKMTYEGVQAPTPQHEEGITEAIWVSLPRIPSYLEHTYPSIRTLFT